MPADESIQRKGGVFARILPTVLKMAVSAALLWFLYSKQDIGRLREAAANADWRWLAFAYGLMILNTVVSAAKWRILLAADSIRMPFASLWASYLIGSFFNLFLPSTIGGDAYRIADVGRRTGKTARAAASILSDRITGFFALSVYGFAASLLVRPLVPRWNNWFVLPPLAAMGALLGVGIVLCNPSAVGFFCRFVPVRGLRSKVAATAGKIADAMGATIRRPSVLLRALALSFLFQFDLMLAVWAITRAIPPSIIPAAVPFATFFLFVPLKTFLEMIPVSVFGLGLRDFGYALFMFAVGVAATRDDTIAAGLISALEVILTFLYVLPGGAVFVFRPKAAPPPATDESAPPTRA